MSRRHREAEQPHARDTPPVTPVHLPDEHRLAEIWHAQWLAPALQLTDGRPLRVIYRGVWTHAAGPDFSDAMLDIDGSLTHGAVELHVRASAWQAHGHDRDPKYCTVVLHVVYWDDLGTPVRDATGRRIPTLILAGQLAGPLETFTPHDWPRLDTLGFTHCAPAVAARDPAALIAIWESAGDERLAGKVARISGQLTVEPPAQVLYALLLDGLGYSANREAMQAVAERLPLTILEGTIAGADTERRWILAAAHLLGVGGFLPLSPRNAALTNLTPEMVQAVEVSWATGTTARTFHTLSPSSWHLHRQRPANHPLRRLLAMASLIAHSAQGLLTDCLTAIQSSDARKALHHWLTNQNPYLGAGRAHELIVNAIVPFTLAYAELLGDDALHEAASTLWHQLPAGPGNHRIVQVREQICGPSFVPVRSARAEQGLLHIGATGCRQLRCFECPVARLAHQRQFTDEM